MNGKYSQLYCSLNTAGDSWRPLPAARIAFRRGGVRTACVAPKSAGRTLRSAGRGKRMIFAQMAGLLAMPTLLPESVLSAEGEDAQAVKSSWEIASSPSIEPGGVGAAWLAAEQSRVLAPPVAHHLCPFGAARRGQVSARHRHQHRPRGYL